MSCEMKAGRVMIEVQFPCVSQFLFWENCFLIKFGVNRCVSARASDYFGPGLTQYLNFLAAKEQKMQIQRSTGSIKFVRNHSVRHKIYIFVQFKVNASRLFFSFHFKTFMWGNFTIKIIIINNKR